MAARICCRKRTGACVVMLGPCASNDTAVSAAACSENVYERVASDLRAILGTRQLDGQRVDVRANCVQSELSGPIAILGELGEQLVDQLLVLSQPIGQRR